MANEQIIDPLNDLLGYLYDSRNGYQECVEVIADPAMKNLFQSLAQQRNNMIRELSAEIKLQGGEPVTDGSAIGAAHRLFVDLKSLVTGGGTKAIVNEVKRGENTLINSYKETLAKELPANIRSLFERQFADIERNLAQVDSLATVATAE